MDLNNVELKVLKLLNDFLNCKMSLENKDTLLPEMDSITFIELVVTLEMEFDIELYDEELLYNHELTVQDWINIIVNHLSEETSRSNESGISFLID